MSVSMSPLQFGMCTARLAERIVVPQFAVLLLSSKASIKPRVLSHMLLP